MSAKIFSFAAICAALTLSTAPTPASACGDVSITEMNWATGQIITAVSKFLMEQGYGCTVQILPSSIAPAVTSAAETGKPDIITEISINSFPPYLDLVAEGKLVEVANVQIDGVVEGWYVPSYLIEAHPELATIDGVLKHPNIVGGRFNNCPQGWGCRIKNDVLKIAFDLPGHGIDVFDHGSGEMLASSVAAAVNNKEPWFGYYWSPSPVVSKYGLVPINLGPYDKDAYECASNKDGCDIPRRTSFAPSPVVTAITPGFVTREPEIVELMSKLSFSSDIMGNLIGWQEENQASAEQTAAYFLQNYPKIWSAWIDDIARERLSALLQ